MFIKQQVLFRQLLWHDWEMQKLLLLSIIFLLGTDLSAENNVIKYSATITRDIYRVPHIHGSSDADAAFGLAYA